MSTMKPNEMAMSGFFRSQLKLAWTPEQGRHLRVAAPTPPGTLLFTCHPYAAVVKDSWVDVVCHHCFKPCPKVIYSCKDCGYARFCSSRCMESAATLHNLECKTLQQGWGEDGSLTSMESESAPLRLLVRILYKRFHQICVAHNERRLSEKKDNTNDQEDNEEDERANLVDIPEEALGWLRVSSGPGQDRHITGASLVRTGGDGEHKLPVWNKRQCLQNIRLVDTTTAQNRFVDVIELMDHLVPAESKDDSNSGTKVTDEDLPVVGNASAPGSAENPVFDKGSVLNLMSIVERHLLPLVDPLARLPADHCTAIIYKIQVNAHHFSVASQSVQPMVLGLFPAASLLNHSCQPTAVTEYLPGGAMNVVSCKQLGPTDFKGEVTGPSQSSELARTPLPGWYGGTEVNYGYINLYESRAERTKLLDGAFFIRRQLSTRIAPLPTNLTSDGNGDRTVSQVCLRVACCCKRCRVPLHRAADRYVDGLLCPSYSCVLRRWCLGRLEGTGTDDRSVTACDVVRPYSLLLEGALKSLDASERNVETRCMQSAYVSTVTGEAKKSKKKKKKKKKKNAGGEDNSQAQDSKEQQKGIESVHKEYQESIQGSICVHCCGVAVRRVADALADRELLSDRRRFVCGSDAPESACFAQKPLRKRVKTVCGEDLELATKIFKDDYRDLGFIGTGMGHADDTFDMFWHVQRSGTHRCAKCQKSDGSEGKAWCDECAVDDVGMPVGLYDETGRFQKSYAKSDNSVDYSQEPEDLDGSRCVALGESKTDGGALQTPGHTYLRRLCQVAQLFWHGSGLISWCREQRLTHQALDKDADGQPVVTESQLLGEIFGPHGPYGAGSDPFLSEWVLGVSTQSDRVASLEKSSAVQDLRKVQSPACMGVCPVLGDSAQLGPTSADLGLKSGWTDDIARQPVNQTYLPETVSPYVYMHPYHQHCFNLLGLHASAARAVSQHMVNGDVNSLAPRYTLQTSVESKCPITSDGKVGQAVGEHRGALTAMRGLLSCDLRLLAMHSQGLNMQKECLHAWLDRADLLLSLIACDQKFMWQLSKACLGEDEEQKSRKKRGKNATKLCSAVPDGDVEDITAKWTKIPAGSLRYVHAVRVSLVRAHALLFQGYEHAKAVTTRWNRVRARLDAVTRGGLCVFTGPVNALTPWDQEAWSSENVCVAYVSWEVDADSLQKTVGFSAVQEKE